MLVRHADNLAELARRGGALAAQCRLLVVRCESCRAAYLYDEVADRLYVDPDDLALVVDAAADAERDVSCPTCHRAHWMFEDVPADEIDEILAGPWSFCFWRPRAARPPRSRLRRIGAGLAIGTLVLLGAAALVLNPDPLASPDAARKRVHVAD
jgi:hypothetical protein